MQSFRPAASNPTEWGYPRLTSGTGEEQVTSGRTRPWHPGSARPAVRPIRRRSGPDVHHARSPGRHREIANYKIINIFALFSIIPVAIGEECR